MEYIDRYNGQKMDIDILHKFPVHDDFGRDIVAFRKNNMIKLAYIHPAEGSIETINDIEKIKEACIRTLGNLSKNVPVDTMIEQNMIVSSKNITKYKSRIMEEQNVINSIRYKQETGEIDQDIDKTIQKYCDGQVPDSLRQTLKQKIDTMLENKIADSKKIKSENEKLLNNEQKMFEMGLNEVRTFYDKSNKVENIRQRIVSVLELTQYCQKQLNKQSNIKLNQEEQIEKYEKLERKRLSYLHELKNYSYIKSKTELKSHENRKYEKLESRINDLTLKIAEIENKDASVINNSIFSNHEIRYGLLLERALRESLNYVEKQINMQNKIGQKLQDRTVRSEDNLMMNIIVNEENKKDSTLYRIADKIKSSKIKKNALNRLKNCKLVKNNLVIGIQNLTFKDIKSKSNKVFSVIKNSKLGTNKLSTKISGFISRRAFKINKFRNSINSMTDDLENANKRK